MKKHFVERTTERTKKEQEEAENFRRNSQNEEAKGLGR